MPSSRPSITGNIIWEAPTQSGIRIPDWYQTPRVHPPQTALRAATQRYSAQIVSVPCYVEPTKEEVPMSMKKFDMTFDVTICSECSSPNIVGTSDPNVHRECLNCGALMLTDGDVLKMIV